MALTAIEALGLIERLARHARETNNDDGGDWLALVGIRELAGGCLSLHFDQSSVPALQRGAAARPALRLVWSQD
ncbi:hypothetical protein JQ615_28175 [Bradyrhizobium jicamae]|uniref:Uncharacterized protein n=1 Tax=Bradyrhizobium jicamae TaxID=280332 RepID=A0ABS5FR84_9BRAD|nr:hypothetical protein [Bradyrhizobium jicamae]MBR0799273.1 hypothetical protein [Bradyrhizobium jicamae]